jgi:tRNA (guanine37-N1)-methyltransferase
MKIDILTIFPSMFEGFVSNSIIKRAIEKEVVSINIIDIRPFSNDKNKRVDDYPLGGGAGMIMKCQPVLDCLKSIKKENSKVILMSPRGKTFNQTIAHDLVSNEDHLIFICGHYEGLDERINKHVDMFLSIGDYILTGGELASMVISDALVRLIDGAIKNESTSDESFENGLLEYPQYTFPRVYDEDEVPAILFTGNHEAIRKYRLKESLRITKENRKDLLVNRNFTKEELKLLKEIEENEENPKWMNDALTKAKKFM